MVFLTLPSRVGKVRSTALRMRRARTDEGSRTGDRGGLHEERPNWETGGRRGCPRPRAARAHGALPLALRRGPRGRAPIRGSAGADPRPRVARGRSEGDPGDRATPRVAHDPAPPPEVGVG